MTPPSSSGFARAGSSFLGAFLGILFAIVGFVLMVGAVLLGLAAIPLAIRPVRSVLGGATGAALIPVLGETGKLQLAWGVLVTIGLAL